MKLESHIAGVFGPHHVKFKNDKLVREVGINMQKKVKNPKDKAKETPPQTPNKFHLDFKSTVAAPVGSAELSARAYGNNKLYSLKGSNDNSGLSAQIFGPDKRQNMYMTDSYSCESYEKFFLDSPTEEIIQPSSSDISGNSAHPQGAPSYQPRKSSGSTMFPQDPYNASFNLTTPCDGYPFISESDYLDIESPYQLDYDEYKMKLKLQELERALLEDNEEDDEDGMFGNSQSMEMDAEWSDPIQNGMLHDSPKESSSSDSNLSSFSSNKELAEALKVPFEFHAVASKTSVVSPSMLNCKPGEALVVNFAFQLHHMPDESVSTVNERDQLLRMAKSLNPKLVTVVEQDVNTNTAPFFPRFTEAYNYYSAVFDSLDATLPRESQDRLNVEKQCLARDIVNIVACEGEERIERYEVAGKWRARMMMAGFTSCSISPSVVDLIRKQIKQYCDRYMLKEEVGALHFGWEDKSLVFASAWK
ncbi:scarecrow-like protein 1 [Populus alba x Populus x berolinensis]|nr:scarecrow-like protein 1 [Populus alba x Populus x berolinensis]